MTSPSARPTPTPLALPSPAAIGAANDLCYEFIVEHCALAESYVRSAGEAAWSGDRQTLGTHLRQLRLVVIALLKTYNEIADVAAEKECGMSGPLLPLAQMRSGRDLANEFEAEAGRS